MKYPITITEVPHRGEPRTWTLESAEHLNDILNGSQMTRSDYDEWCEANGYFEWKSWEEEGAERFEVLHDRRFEAETYLEWLRHDLSQLIVEEVTGD